MAEERRVSARLDVTKEGDVEAFRELKEDVDQLASAASEGDAIAELFDRLAKALEKTKKAVDAADLEGQEQGLRDVAEALAAMAPELQRAFDQGVISAERYAQGMEQVAAAQRVLQSSTIETARGVNNAVKALQELDKSVENGFEGAEEKVARARHAMDEYRRSVEAAKRAGEDVGEAEIRQLAELERRYQSAIEQVGRYRAAQRQAARDIDTAAAATERELGNVSSLSDLITTAVPKWGRYVGAAGAVVGVFGSAYDAGTKLRTALNELSGGAFDQFVQNSIPVRAAVAALSEEFDELAVDAEQTAFFMEQLWRKGINPTGLSAAEVRQKVLELGRAVADGSKAANKATREHEEYAKSLGLSSKELEKQAEALATFINRFRAESPEPLSKELVEQFSERLRTILDLYAKLGREAPEEIRKIAAEWKVLTTAEEEAVEKHLELVDQYLESITGIAKGSIEQLRAEADALVQAVGEIDFEKNKGLRTEVFQRIQELVKGLVDRFRDAGELVPEALARIADKANVVVYAYERMGTFAFESGKAAAEGQVRVIEKLDEHGKKVREVVQVYDGMGPAATAAGESAAEGQVRVIEKLDEHGNKVREVTNAHEQQGAAAEAAAERAARGTVKVIEREDEHGNKIKEVVQVYDEAGEKAGIFYDEISVKAEEGAESVSKAADATRDGAAAAGEAAGSLSDAARSTEQLAEGAQAAEGQMGSLEDRLKTVNEGIAENQEKVGALEERLRGLGAAWPTAFAGAAAALSPINAELDTTIGKLATVEQKLANIRNAGAGGEAAAVN